MKKNDVSLLNKSINFFKNKKSYWLLSESFLHEIQMLLPIYKQNLDRHIYRANVPQTHPGPQWPSSRRCGWTGRGWWSGRLTCPSSTAADTGEPPAASANAQDGSNNRPGCRAPAPRTARANTRHHIEQLQKHTHGECNVFICSINVALSITKRNRINNDCFRTAFYLRTDLEMRGRSQ